MNSLKRDMRRFDFVLLALVVILAGFGVLMVGSATGLGDGRIDPAFTSQIIFSSTGIIILLVAAFIKHEVIVKFYWPIFAVNIALLGIVLLMPATRGATRWIPLEVFGMQMGIQPSEFAKIFMIIFLAKLIDKHKENINKIWLVGLVMATVAVPFVLINLQPSFSASTVIVIIMLTMLFVAKISYKYVIVAFVVIIPILLFLFVDIHREYPWLLESELVTQTQFNRIWNFLYPEYGDTWQNDRALLALSSGLLTGRGLFNNQIHIPEFSNDFIFAVIGAELGFLGSLAVMSVVLAIVIRCMIIANRAQTLLGRLIASATGVVIAYQSFVHIAINAFLLPNTGMNLPFVSSGGSSMWVFMAMIGLTLNIGMVREVSMFESLGAKAPIRNEK